jgi:hypothetical protein
VYAEEDTLSQNERPTIALKATLGAEGSILEGEVTANGVKSSEWIYVSINGAQELDTGVEGSTLLYKTRAGPDANGKVDIKFTLPVVRLFDFIRIGATRANGSEDEVVDPCFPSPGKGAEDQSCATFYPPHGPSRPTLTATLTKGAAGANLLNATIKTSGLDPDDVVLVDVSNAKTGGIFYRSMFSGSSAGAVDAEAKVSIPTGKTVCVVASTIKSTDTAAQQVQPKTRTCRIDSFDLSQSSFVFIAAPSAT